MNLLVRTYCKKCNDYFYNENDVMSIKEKKMCCFCYRETPLSVKKALASKVSKKK